MASNKTVGGRLATAVHDVGARVRECSGRKSSIGEENTKAVLIEPIISALGWDLTDLDVVLREYRPRAQDNPVDYALFLHSSPLLLVEAKALGTNLSGRKWASQLLGYATVVGVEWCVLTDGDEYRIYNVHAPLDVEEKLFHTIRITDGAEEERTRQTLELLSRQQLDENTLGRLWEAHCVDKQVKSVLMDLFAGDDSLIRLIKKRGQDLTPLQIKDSLGRADIGVDYPGIVDRSSGETARKAKPRRETARKAKPRRETARKAKPRRETARKAKPRRETARKAKPRRETPRKTQTRPSPTRTGRRATTISIAGETYECAHAKNILIHVANWLVAHGKLGPEDCPVVLTQGQIRCQVNTSPRHPGGLDFKSPEPLENGLYVEAHYGWLDMEMHARRLLEWAGYPSDMLTVD